MTPSQIAIIGAGTMGRGIGISCAQAGFHTKIFDMNESTLSAAADHADRYFERLAEKEKMSQDEAVQAVARFQPILDSQEISESAIVIEAIHEDLEAKQNLFRQVSGIVDQTAIIATNTSALRVKDLAETVSSPGRFLGIHYFSPAEINPLVELVSGPKTSRNALSAAKNFLGQTGKEVLQCQDASGFAVNRFFCPYANEAVRIVDEGFATPAQIDRIACALFDLAMGPFAVMEIVKPRIMLNAVRNLAPLGPFYTPAAGLIMAGETNSDWKLEEQLDTLPDHVIQKIEDRLSGAIWLPILEAESEGVASFADFDTGAKMALRFRRPPTEMMREKGAAETARIVCALASRTGQKSPTLGLERFFS